MRSTSMPLAQFNRSRWWIAASCAGGASCWWRIPLIPARRLQRLFQRRECKVTTAASGEEALELAQREVPEIVISDIGLPGISGLELMSRLRARPEFRGVIAIALSGLGREQDIRGAAEAGFDAHLLKPVDIAVLDQTLIQALQKKA